jgi:hypothetical protein
VSDTQNPTSSRKRWNEKTKQQAFSLLGARCAVCGEDDLRCLQIDHREGTDLASGANLRSGTSLYRAIVTGVVPLAEFQVLCANHNVIKRIENGEHRGYKERRGSDATDA